MRKRALSLALVIVVALVFPFGGTATALKRFTFFGSAWGHGVGLAQYGAYGLAVKGWNYKRILTHFYSHTRVDSAGSVPSQIRVGLAQGRRQIHVTASGGPVKLRVGSSKGDLVGEVPGGYTWTVLVQNGRYQVLDAKGRMVGDHLWGGPSEHLFARYGGTGGTVFFPEAGHHYRRGWVEFNIAGQGLLRLIAVLSPQEYLYGLGEVPSSWPEAALRAQAIAARTYAFEKIRRLGQHREGCNCGLYGSTLDQAYAGWDKEIAPDADRWVSAVNGTGNQVVLYRGSVIQAFYHSSSGGFTENNENVFGGSPLPYLRGVCDPGDFTAANPNRLWQVTFTAAAIRDRLFRATRKDIGDVRRFSDAARGVSGRIITITVEGTNSSITLTGPQFRRALDLRDSKVWINTNRNVTWPLRDKYDAIGCRPGLATTPKEQVPGGLRQRFESGALFRNSSRGGTHWLYSRVYEFFTTHGALRHFGFPTTDVRRKSGGTVWAAFGGRKIVCRLNHPCREV